MIKVIKASAKLSGTETDNECEAMAAAHSALKDNGWIATIFEADKEGNITHIVSYWKVSKYDKGILERGFFYAYLPERTYELLTKGTTNQLVTES